MRNDFKSLVEEVSTCRLCAKCLPHAPRPVFQASPRSKIIIIGQAPGSKVHASGVPWKDASGTRLREWLGVSEATFYDDEIFALLPMGFCYPGKGKSGDLPPRVECAPLWHPQFFEHFSQRTLTLLTGKFAQDYYIKAQSTLTETVRSYESYLPHFFPLPHPSPRNNIWLRKNPWFEPEVLPELQRCVGDALKVRF